MNNMTRKRLTMLLLALLLVFSLAACGQGGSGQEPQTQQVTDLAGNEVTLAKDVKKVISLSPSTTEILFALNAGEQVVGVDAFSNYPEQAAGKEVVGDYNGPNIEAIVALEPDVVMANEQLHADALTQLKNAGVEVVAVEARSFEEIVKSIEIIGQIVGKQDEATALVKSMNDGVDAIKAEARSLKEVRVYYSISFGSDGNWTVGEGSFIFEMIKIAGGTPVTEGAKESAPWMNYTPEAVVETDPDIIIMSFGTLDDLKEAQGFKDLKAVKDGKAYLVNEDIISRPGPRVIEALQELQKILKEAQ